MDWNLSSHSTIELHPRSCCVTGFGRPHRRMRGDPRGAEPIRQVRALSKRPGARFRPLPGSRPSFNWSVATKQHPAKKNG